MILGGTRVKRKRRKRRRRERRRRRRRRRRKSKCCHYNIYVSQIHMYTCAVITKTHLNYNVCQL